MKIKTDVAVIGAGVIGSAVAMNLVAPGSRGNAPEVVVVDLDLEGSFSSSELNAGGVRAIWNHPINIQLSKASIDYYESVAEEVGLRQQGYFWMYSKDQWASASGRIAENAKTYGLPVEFLEPPQITGRHPFLNKVSDLGGATFSPRDGLINPNLLKNHFRSQAASRGAVFEDRVYVTGIEQNGLRVKVIGTKFSTPLTDTQRALLLTKHLIPENLTFEKIEIDCEKLVIAGGAWACQFQEMLGVPVVSRPVRRQVSLFESKAVDLTDKGMFVDPSGVYFHAEAQFVLSGFAIESEPDGFNFDYDGQSFFEEHIWSALHERSSGFEMLKHVTGWAGLYEVSPDRCGIMGSVNNSSQIFEAHSFSGRGVMQSWAVGRGLSELILNERFETIDLAALSGERFKEGKLVRENLLI